MSQKEEVGVVEEDFRALARIVILDDVLPHTNANALEPAVVGGWQMVVKLGEFKKGDKALFCEIDSMVPTARPEFAFLEARSGDVKVINEVSYARLKTQRIRKELSQGLVVPLPAEFRQLPVDTNLTDKLGVLKYEKKVVTEGDPTSVVRTSLMGRLGQWVYGKAIPSQLLQWPSFLSKSEERRIQNIGGIYAQAVANDEKFEESVKLNGSSMTVYSVMENAEDVMSIRTGVCSRNFEIDQKDIVIGPWQAKRHWLGNLIIKNMRMLQIRKPVWPKDTVGVKAWFSAFKELNHDMVRFNFSVPAYVTLIPANRDPFLKFVLQAGIMKKLRAHAAAQRSPDECITLQGELIGPGIASNFEGVDKTRFAVYRVYKNGKTVVMPSEARSICAQLEVEYVPILSPVTTLPPTLKEALVSADGPRAFAKGGFREGKVYKSLIRDFSFKVISNKFLEKEA